MSKKINIKITEDGADIIGAVDIKKSWSDFTSRQRYIKGADGDYMKDTEGKTLKYYERLWVGRLASKVSFLKTLIEDGSIADDSVVYILTVGSTCEVQEDGAVKINHNVVLVYDEVAGVIYYNKNNKTNATQYVDFLQGETDAEVKEADLPTVKHSRGVKITDVKSALQKAVDVDVDVDF